MYIVTGGAGLIGSAIIWGLNQRGIFDILVVDHLGTSDKWKNLASLQYTDYMERDEFSARLQNGEFDEVPIEGIFHLGACSATTERDASYLAINNFGYTKMLAHFACDRNIRMMYASSCATYGDGSLGYKDDEANIESLRPLNMYGYSKQMFDRYAKETGMLNRIFGCKFSNVYGPNERHKANMRSVVLRAYEQISTTGTMELFRSYHPDYADGEFMRDFLYVKDAVAMVLHLFDCGATGLYNVGSGRAETWNALATAAFEAMSKPVNIKYIDMPESLRDRYQYYTCTEIDKLRNTGYTAEVGSLKDSIRDMICNYLIPGKYLGD